MTLDNNLMRYIPKQDLGAEVEVREEYALVVQRISEVIPDNLLWKIFSSIPNETRGRIIFPYSRIDSALIVARDYADLLESSRERISPEKFKEWYDSGCIQAFEALLWVEIGFQGLENLAKSLASKNWTSGVGHSVNDEERAQRIMTEGNKLYNECLSKFAQFRRKEGITDDYFGQYKVEHLLERFY